MIADLLLLAAGAVGGGLLTRSYMLGEQKVQRILDELDRKYPVVSDEEDAP